MHDPLLQSTLLHNLSLENMDQFHKGLKWPGHIMLKTKLMSDQHWAYLSIKHNYPDGSKSTIKANTKNDLQYFREEVDFLTAEWIFFKAIRAILGKVPSANVSSEKQMIPDILVIIYQTSWGKLHSKPLLYPFLLSGKYYAHVGLECFKIS